MFPIITFPIQVESQLWKTFKARVQSEGLTSKAVITRLIEHYIDHGMPEPPAKKKKDKDA